GRAAVIRRPFRPARQAAADPTAPASSRPNQRGGRGVVTVAAVDLGASSGRVMLGTVSGVGPTGSIADGRLTLDELAQFPSEPGRVGGRLDWDILALYRSILEGLRSAAPLDGIGIESWGVDHGLLDADGVLLGNPV